MSSSDIHGGTPVQTVGPAVPVSYTITCSGAKAMDNSTNVVMTNVLMSGWRSIVSQFRVQQSSVKEVVLITAISGTKQKVKAIYIYTQVYII